MPPNADDGEIGNDSYLLRVLHSSWTTLKGGRERPTSDSLLDSNFENSCFVEGEIAMDELRLLFPDKKIARIPVHLIRAHGFIIERRPLEAPNECTVPESHVVIGPQDQIQRGEYERMARTIVKSATVSVIDPSDDH